MAVASRGSDQFPVRMPDGLRDRIKASAANEHRSMNSAIIAALEAAFPAEAASLAPRMELRDWFAGQALMGMTASPELMQLVTSKADGGEGVPFERLGRSAYKLADAMLAARTLPASTEAAVNAMKEAV